MIKDKVFLFDIDGTLTPPLKSMTTDFMYFFLSWCADKKFYLVGGSDSTKIRKQVPHSICSRAIGVFSSMGNVLEDSKGDIIYSNEWSPTIKLRTDLLKILSESSYKNKKNKNFEKRIGMLNFSVAGRDSTDEERRTYYEWDKDSQERVGIVKQLSRTHTNLDFRIGGMISIDIQPKGGNKSQACEWVRKNHKSEIIYFGDKVFKNGNDYDAHLNLIKNKDGVCQKVTGPEDTKKILLKEYS